jgi:hypothetical protein
MVSMKISGDYGRERIRIIIRMALIRWIAIKKSGGQ